MLMYSPETLLNFVRDGLIEQCHSGFLVLQAKDKFLKLGMDYEYPFYLRSCAKPLQASLLVDYGLIEAYDMNAEEIAVCCASHAGEDCHINAIKSLMKKVGLDESLYKCGLHKPLSKTKQEEMLLNNEPVSVLHNNCSGKHTMMLAVCKKNGWDLNNYDKLEHPLQQKIKEKIYTLCELDKDYPVTKDGCGVPIFSMPLKNMLNGYINLFSDEKYSKIKDAIFNNPYIMGGEDRLDTAIISGGLIAKVGAGGLCIIINPKTNEGLLVKIMDCNMQARAIVTIEALKQLGWLVSENEYLKQQNAKDILTLHGDKVGEAEVCFNLKELA